MNLNKLLILNLLRLISLNLFNTANLNLNLNLFSDNSLRKSICTASKVYLYGLEKRKSLRLWAKTNRIETIVIPFYSLIFAEFFKSHYFPLRPP